VSSFAAATSTTSVLIQLNNNNKKIMKKHVTCSVNTVLFFQFKTNRFYDLHL
jgi:hypothetical protein